MPAEVVFFDVGGTLVEVSPSVGQVYAQACRTRGAHVRPADLQQAFDEAWGRMSELVPPGANRYGLFAGGEREWWERISAKAFDLCGVPAERRPAVDELRAVFATAAAWRLYPEARQVLGDLRGRGFRLAVLSNWDSRLPALLQALELQSHFEAVVYSAQTGVEKPHPRIFQTALEAMKVEPERAVHIGDRLDEDYSGARSAGLRALLVRRGARDEAIHEEVGRRGDSRDLVVDLRDAARRVMES